MNLTMLIWVRQTDLSQTDVDLSQTYVVDLRRRVGLKILPCHIPITYQHGFVPSLLYLQFHSSHFISSFYFLF